MDELLSMEGARDDDAEDVLAMGDDTLNGEEFAELFLSGTGIGNGIKGGAGGVEMFFDDGVDVKEICIF